LFRSPEPNPKLWTSGLLGKIKAAPAQSGLGWYQELITLQAPYLISLATVPEILLLIIRYVHENPDASWFNPSILEKCRSSLSDPNAITGISGGMGIDELKKE
jgi:hypothetical protein